MTKLRVLDLFSGIGGFSLGLERTGGFETVAFCEIEPFPRRVLAKHWPEVPCYEDVTTADFAALGPVDLVTAGFPCQDISFDGKCAGLAGERSGLFWHVLRAASLVGRPQLLLENVAALLDRGMGAVLGALASFGYDAQWHCIPAGYVGAPHERDRIWIAANTTEKPGLHQSDAWENPKRLPFYRNYWSANPWIEANAKLCRMDDGVSDRVDRTAALGNSIVPQIPELIGQAIWHDARSSRPCADATDAPAGVFDTTQPAASGVRALHEQTGGRIE